MEGTGCEIICGPQRPSRLRDRWDENKRETHSLLYSIVLCKYHQCNSQKKLSKQWRRGLLIQRRRWLKCWKIETRKAEVLAVSRACKTIAWLPPGLKERPPCYNLRDLLGVKANYCLKEKTSDLWWVFSKADRDLCVQGTPPPILSLCLCFPSSVSHVVIMEDVKVTFLRKPHQAGT